MSSIVAPMPVAVATEQAVGPVTIDGRHLHPAAVRAIARDGAPVRVDPEARRRMAAAAEIVARAAAAGEPVYGVTTGLGARATQAVGDGAGAEYSLRTIRGRATAVGEPLSRELTRAAMAVRLSGLCAGGAGAAPAVAESLAALLNHGVHPRVPRSGSVGAADLCLMAHVGLALVGEGEAERHGAWMPAGEALRAAGLAPLTLGPKDGLAICSSSAVSAGAAALALQDARDCLRAAQVSAALAMEGFRANLDPLDPRAVAARPAPGQGWACDGLRAQLAGGSLAGGGPARRIQDPLSFRCAGQSHGSLWTALGWLQEALAPELAGAADNPLVLAGDAEILHTGNFQVSALALALDATAIAVAQVAHGIAERASRLTEPRLSGLPGNLIDPAIPGATTHSGVGAVGKTAHALVLEIRHAAAPLAILPAIVADGVEDDSTGATQGALRLGEQLTRLRLLVALELLVAAQAVDIAGIERLGPGTGAAHRCVRELSARLGEDRPLGPEIERIESELVAGGRLLAATDAAVATGAR